MDWKSELAHIVRTKAKSTRAAQENAEFERFLSSTVKPAFDQIAEELRKLGREVVIRTLPAASILSVRFNGNEEIVFQIVKHYAHNGLLPSATVRLLRNQKLTSYQNILLRPDAPLTYTLAELTQDDVIACFLKHYRMILGD